MHPATSWRWHKHVLAAILVVYLVIGIGYTIATPPGEGVDEIAHLDYVLFLKENKRLPLQNGSEQQVGPVMGHHPPFYYGLAAILITPIPTSDRLSRFRPNPHFSWDEGGASGWNVMLPDPANDFPWRGSVLALHALRLVNVLLGGVALLFVYLSLWRLLPGQPWVPLGATAIVGLNPAFVYMSSTVHHDTLLVTLSSAILYWCCRVAATPVNLHSLLGISVLLAAATLTKVSGLILAPAVTLVLLWRPVHAQDWGKRLGQLAFVGGISATLAGWWFLRNQLLYGDPLGLTLYQSRFWFNMRETPFTWGLFVHEFLAQLEKTFWGAFGFMHILLPESIRDVVWGGTALLLLGWVPILLRLILGRLSLSRSTLVAGAALMAAFLFIFAFYVRVASTTLGAGHGRYLFPAAVTIGAVGAVGINGYGHWRYQRSISLGLTLLMAGYAIIAPALYVWSKYRIPEPVGSAQLASASPLHIFFEPGVELVAVSSSSAVVIPGQGLDITTYWAAEPQSHKYADPYLSLTLHSEDGEFLGNAAFWPEVSTVPAVWGERIVANRQSFYIPPEQMAGRIYVQIQAMDGKNGPPLAVRGRDADDTRVPILTLLALGAVAEVSEAAIPAPQRQEVFAGAVRLAALSLPESILAGETLPVTFYWHVLASIQQDYILFVHVLDEGEQIVAQLDRPPGGGTSPTSTWQPGQFLQDTYPVQLPATLLAGEYQIRMGLYTWPDLMRQPVTVQGVPSGDSLLVGRFTVVEP